MSETVYSEEQARRWLGFLAQNMASRGQSIFMVENLQPTWIDSRAFRMQYLLLSRYLIYGIAVLTLAVCNLVYLRAEGGHPWNRTRAGEFLFGNAIAIFLLPAISLCLELVLKKQRQARNAWSSGFARHSVETLFLVAQWTVVFVLMSYYPSDGLRESTGIPLSAYSAPILNIFIAVHRSRRPIEEDIRPVERLSWSWPAFGNALLPYRSWVTAVGMAAIAVFLLAGTDANETSAGAITFGGYLLLRAANQAFQGAEVPLKTKPNSGIWLSFRNAVLVLCGAFAIVGLLIAVNASDWLPREGNISIVFNVRTAVQLAMFLLPPFALSRALVIGGIAFSDHFVLRALLARFGCAPFQYVRFLDYAADHLGFLQKAGGGYVFMHRNLMEYFAAGEKQEVALV